MKHSFFYCLLLLVASCNTTSKKETTASTGSNPVMSIQDYHDNSNYDDQFTGGIKMIPIQTPKGEFKVWTKRVGHNPKIKVLLLHGGPGMTHELYECFDGYFPQEGIEYYYYDQLGSYYSDQPDDLSLWDLPRFVEEVEQVRQALGLNQDNFYLLGQSWGGILAMEYALKYQQHLKGLIISNMVASIPEYQHYSDEVLAPQLPPEVLEEIMVYETNEDYSNERYLNLVMEHYYTAHILRMPLDQWPNSVNRAIHHTNPDVYVTMQGPSEFGIKGDATLKDWDIKNRLHTIAVPTLSIGAQYDTMDPEHMKWIAQEVQQGRFLYCANGSHLSQYDDQKTYFEGVITFLKDVDAKTF
ncbi:proline iminopeptidase-family hydrolase [Aestuariivivens sediminis]|uniref:proline iminopeptidase-family hydrolase n=1 Tax=Aestuariivivens sediminis TaxID=2913557 RepID=UPI001F5A9274|nr:proline iminopeptidase-family hydrolase [Aestuariivivens sediminis]